MKVNKHIPDYQTFKESWLNDYNSADDMSDETIIDDPEVDSILAKTKVVKPITNSTEDKETKFNELVNMLTKKSNRIAAMDCYFTVLDCCTLHFIEKNDETDETGKKTEFEEKIEVYYDEEKEKFFVGADEYSTAQEVFDFLMMG